MFQLVAIGLFVVAALFVGREAWSNFKDGIGAPYAAAQMAKDQETVDAKNDEVTQLKAAADEQNRKLEELAATAKQAQADNAAIWAEYQKDKAANASKIAGLKALAAQKPQPQECAKELADTDQVLTDTATRMRQ